MNGTYIFDCPVFGECRKKLHRTGHDLNITPSTTFFVENLKMFNESSSDSDPTLNKRPVQHDVLMTNYTLDKIDTLPGTLRDFTIDTSAINLEKEFNINGKNNLSMFDWDFPSLVSSSPNKSVVSMKHPRITYLLNTAKLITILSP